MNLERGFSYLGQESCNRVSDLGHYQTDSSQHENESSKDNLNFPVVKQECKLEDLN